MVLQRHDARAHESWLDAYVQSALQSARRRKTVRQDARRAAVVDAGSAADGGPRFRHVQRPPEFLDRQRRVDRIGRAIAREGVGAGARDPGGAAVSVYVAPSYQLPAPSNFPTGSSQLEAGS